MIGLIVYAAFGIISAVVVWGLTIGYFCGYFCGYPAGVSLGNTPESCRHIAIVESALALFAWPLMLPMVLWLSGFGKHGLRWR